MPGCLLESTRITIDAGHGGDNPGGVGHQLFEDELALDYAQALTIELVRRGHLVTLTRNKDEDVSLSDRAQTANDAYASLLISLHLNTSLNSKANGAWVIHHHMSTKGRALAMKVFERLRDIPGLEDQDKDYEVYPDKSSWVNFRSLAILRLTRMPAILVELGFLTNSDDAQQLSQEVMFKRIARGLADGIEDWLRRP